MNDLRLFFNELSLHGQFANDGEFRNSIHQLMQIRQIIQRYHRELYCHQKLANREVTQNVMIPGGVKALPSVERRALMAWIGKTGPFWDVNRMHRCSDWYESNGEIVTDTSLAEAAHCISLGIASGLISIQPSDFLVSSVCIEHKIEEDKATQFNVPNYWQTDTVEACLAKAIPEVNSWRALKDQSIVCFTGLHLTDETFEPLQGQPFKRSASNRILLLLKLLHDLTQCFDESGVLTQGGREILESYFKGGNALFSDSSPSEKSQFRRNLTFSHPDGSNSNLFCTWHGKVNSPPYRIHFSWPVMFTEPIYVVYIGPKITKK